MAQFLKNITDNQEETPRKPKTLRPWHVAFLLLLIGANIWMFYPREKQTENLAASGWTNKNLQRAEGDVFGTFYHITYQWDEKLDEGIKAELDKVNKSLSMFEKTSTITNINNNTSMQTDSMFTHVFNLAKTISAQTDGAFDITVAPLVNLWGFGFKNMDNVTDSAVDSLLQYVGIDGVSLVDGKIVKTHPETMLDCSAIAKGYGVDVVSEYLEKVGVKHYMVEIGGEVRVHGVNPKGENWTIGITSPKDDSLQVNGDIEEVLHVNDIAMATSGNYRNFYMKDGKKFAHTIDPRTGRPVQHNILSSTVLAKDCATADAYATSFMVLGLEDARKVLEKHPELMAFFIYNDKDGNSQKWYSPKLKERLSMNKE